MKVILVRHGYAGDPDPSKWPDDNDRPLTKKGAKQFKKAAEGLANVAPQPTYVIAAPAVRTNQTAEILHEHGGWPQAKDSNNLRDGADITKAGKELTALHAKGHEVIGVVGHEPNLACLALWLLRGETKGTGPTLTKGSAAIIDWHSQPGSGSLEWMIPRKALAGLR